MNRAVRFAVICDAHVERAGDMHSAYFRQALRQAAEARPDFLVVLGDLTARGARESLDAVGDAARQYPLKTYFLPGNSDIRDAAIEAYREVFGETRFCFSLGGFLFLGVDTSRPAIGVEQREWIEQRIAEAGPARLVLFTHIPPEKLDSDSAGFVAQTLRKGRAVLCVAGHSHRPSVTETAGVPVHVLGGVDPFKPVPVLPGFDLFTLGSALRAERREITLLNENLVASVLRRMGAAPRDFSSAEHLVGFLEEQGLCHVQLKSIREGISTVARALEDWRGRNPSATVSLHLQNPKLDEAGRLQNRAGLQGEMGDALALGAVSVSLHLPKIDSGLVMGEDGGLWPSPFTRTLIGELVELVRPLAERGIEIHLENLRWRGEGLKDERSLGTAPSHLLAFRSALDDGLGNPGLGRVGFTFDVGHAWGNGALASKYPVYRWVEALHPHIRSVHLHDTAPREGRQVNHQPLGAEGGTVNFEGTFYLLAHLATEAVVYLEMENLEDIRLSLERLRGWAAKQRAL